MNIKFYYFHTDAFVFFSHFSQKYKVYNQKEIFRHMHNDIKIVSNNKIIIPTYNFSFPEKKIFDYYNDRSEVGAFSEYFRKIYKKNRTEVPIFSDTSNYNLKKIAKTKNPFDKHSVFEYLKNNNGEIVTFGSDFAPTYIMYIEKNYKNGPFYRFEKKFNGIIKKRTEKKVSIKFFCRPLTIKINYDLKKIQHDLLVEGILKQKKSESKFTYTLLNCKDFSNYAQYKLNKNHFYFLTKKNEKYLKRIIQKNGRFEQRQFE